MLAQDFHDPTGQGGGQGRRAGQSTSRTTVRLFVQAAPLEPPPVRCEPSGLAWVRQIDPRASRGDVVADQREVDELRCQPRILSGDPARCAWLVPVRRVQRRRPARQRDSTAPEPTAVPKRRANARRGFRAAWM